MRRASIAGPRPGGSRPKKSAGAGVGVEPTFAPVFAIVWLAASVASADPAPSLAALAPADDARRAVAIGPAGEVYEPDGAGAWVRTQRFTTATTLAIAGRAGTAVVANGGGVVYKLAPNGWSAIRLAQKGEVVMSGGLRAVAAVGRQLYWLDRTKAGEPEKLALAGSSVLAIGSGKTVVFATDAGVFRVDGTKLTVLGGAPRKVTAFVTDQWALVDRSVVDLRTNKPTSWPAGLAVGPVTTDSDGNLVAIGTHGGALELVTLRAGKLAREPVAITPVGKPVGVVADRGGRVVVALQDGRLAIRDRGTWTTTTVREVLPAPRPGPAPAPSK
jgi:hypothetical protein